MLGLRGKNLLVTGGSSGIGQAIAVRFAEEGANVAINYRRGLKGAQATQQQIESQDSKVKSLLIQADVGVEEEVIRMFDTALAELGGLDILINNAGFLIGGESHEASVSDFMKVIATNLTGAFQCAQLAIKHFLAEQKPGVVINVSSVHEVIPKPLYAGYSASKGGMGNLTRTLALEYAKHGIRVNGIGPGATITPMNDAWKDAPEKRAIVESHIPMGRSGTSEEMAAAAAFLASDEASYITGQTLYIDGGLTLYPEFAVAWSTD
ncbi:MAG: glucose 1-dehydrogenase [Planctomycetota bacterium]|nr:glucose 1-dehydrogenase [Planctomycetota bacterium]MDA1141540.1 glucose 1-dehydrogenase [Planctomycetota bacterium]